MGKTKTTFSKNGEQCSKKINPPRHTKSGRGLRLPALLFLVIGHQVIERGLQVVAEAAPFRVGVTKRPPHETQGELLEQLVGGVRVADRAEQVAIDRPLVAADEGHTGRAGRRLRRAAGVGQHGPDRGDPT